MRFRLEDGAELFYTIDDFTDPWKEPETVVLHHGMSKNHLLWYTWIPMLAAKYRVVRFDMRGMGQSTLPPQGYPWSVDNFANDLAQFVDGLGLKKFHLIGETVGATVGMRYASLHQERLLSLAIGTTRTHFTDPRFLEIADTIDREGIGAFVEQSMVNRLDPGVVGPAFIRWYASQMAATTGYVYADWNKGCLGTDLRHLLKDIQTPTIIMAAELLHGGMSTDLREAAELFPNCRLVVFPGIRGFIMHILPVPCARIWMEFAESLKVSGG